MALDRDAILKQAEKLLRQGKLDGAIAEYVRLVEDQPRDWNAINALGDLYGRAGQADRAAAQFVRIADHLLAEGILPKAAALYRKALKVKPDDDHTLLQLADTAARQGLLGDARTHLRQLARQRRERGNEQGALDCLLRLGSLDDADPEAQAAAGRAAHALGDTPRAVALYVEASEGFEKAGRHADALDALAEAARLQPGNHVLSGRMARHCIAAGQLERAGAFLTREAAGDDPELLVMLGRIELAAGREQDARIALTRLLTVAPDRRADIMALVEEFAGTGHDAAAYGCLELIVDDAVLAGDWDAAIAALDGFTARSPHVAALMKLVEIAVDAGRDEPMRHAQSRLADVYLESGRGAEARAIAEDLVVHDPRSDVHIGRLRRALELAGEPDVDEILARYREPVEPVESFDDVPTFDERPSAPEPAIAADADPEPQLESEFLVAAGDRETLESLESIVMVMAPSEGVSGEPLELVERETAAAPPPDERIVIETVEIDLSDALSQLLAADAAAGDVPDLEEVFEGLRGRASRDREVAEALDRYERGVRHLEAGREAQAIADLSLAARTPMLRFAAAARLGRLHLSRGEQDRGIEWLERAAEAPASAPEDGLAVLYELAAALQEAGESARALAILMEIGTDVHGYKDVAQRIEQLRVKAGGA